ncbi:DUF4158 domain-containing protein [Streptomyces clavifer]|uniref:DUF4158 domain-containing protein n=1 Tax=Streptomyces clavifer TaxID=68188 RepID=UPI00365632AB
MAVQIHRPLRRALPWRGLARGAVEAVEYLAGQLGIEDASCVKRHPERRRTPCEHAAEIQERYRYRDLTDRKWGREFCGFLYGRTWRRAEGPVALFNHAVTWLRSTTRTGARPRADTRQIRVPGRSLSR